MDSISEHRAEPAIEVRITDDDAQLASLGIQPELKRNFNIWSLMFICFCTSVTWEALCSTMAQALTSGGSSSMVWGFLVAACGALLIALCLSEMSSMIPSAGGQYHYVAHLSPIKYRRVFSWFAGWMTLWAWMTSSVSGMFAIAMQIQAYAILFHPEYDYKRWHTSMILIAQITLFSAISAFAIKHLHRLTFLAMASHVAGYFATIIYLLVKVNPKNTAKFVFTDQTNLSGWDNSGAAWSIGLLAAALGFVGWDSSTHLAEEMKNASRDLPRTMWGSVAVSGVLTFPWVIALMFCITDIGGVLSGPVGTISPLVQIMYITSGGSQATTIGMTIFFPIISFAVAGTACVSATSRIVMSFAREGGMPRPFATVSKTWDTPLNAILFTWACMCGLACIYIGNATAFYGLASGTTVCYIASYAMPILVNVIWGIEQSGLKPGSFTLGRYSRYISVIALIWCAYLITFLCFPVYLPVTAVNMNYGCLVLGFGFVAPAILWFVYGSRTYQGVVHGLDGMEVLRVKNGDMKVEQHRIDSKAD